MSDRPPLDILLVDDEPAKLLAYETILSELGERLIRADSGKAALETLLHHEIAVVLVDVCMPELDGFELASMIRSHPRFRKTAIILVSGILVEDVDRLRGYHSGAVDYVSVPIVPEILRAKVAVFAELYRKTEQLERLNRELEQRVAERTQEMARLLREAQEARREAEGANRLKDEFLAILSHELRTPLHAITGWAHLLRGGALDAAQQARAVDTISRNAALQNQLISEILDVSRIVTGKLRLELRPLDLRPVVQAALETVRPMADARRIAIHAELGETGGPVQGDPARLQQVVWNVMVNAIKFTPMGGRVEVEIADAGPSLVLTVRDDGPGIPDEFLPHVFDRFRQADSSSTRPHQGLGLGLAIVKDLVEMHGGSVAASNRPDRCGAVLQVVLPRSDSARGRAAASSAHAAEEPAIPTPPALRGARVLVVDDEADARDVVAALLQRCGVETRVAGSVGEALALVLETHPQVVLTDIEMPGEDGYSLLRRLRTLPEGQGGDAAVAALTAYAHPQDRRKALNEGFLMHVAKPIQPAELIAAVASLVDSWNGAHPGAGLGAATPLLAPAGPPDQPGST